ncbi:SIR2 family protein [Clostridium sp. UBA7339]|uniref:SIR2 family protein n=1 Tax=Clostridium sp. UBA7339 TaxID=1946376 RepID=UPI00321795DD
MGIRIDNSSLFKQTLLNGINLFTGAGFSVLSDKNIRKLPTAEELCIEICKKFKISEKYVGNLETLSSLVEARAAQQYQNFLRERFTVTNYNSKYDLLNRINLKSYITTNIDNIIHCVMDNSKRYYLNSVMYYGASKRNPSQLEYIPLHGEVKNINSKLYFGKFDLAMVELNNRDLFEIMFAKLKETPTLFWGYGFHDSGVVKVISRIIKEKKQDIWIQCMDGDDNIELFKELGCNIIIGDTDELFDWIKKELEEDIKVDYEYSIEAELKKQYGIPTINKVESVPVSEFYINSKTHWYNIISDQAFETKWISNIYNECIENKNVIVVGMQFSGKTTTSMQLALKVASKVKLYVTDLTPEKSQNIINRLRGKQAVIFVDNCAEDMIAFALLGKCANIRIIGFTEEHSFESAKHLLEEVDYKRIDLDEITVSDAQSIYEKIPASIRNEKFLYKKSEEEKFSMLEMMSLNVKNIITEEKIKSILLNINTKFKEGFNIVALTSYLTVNKSVLSTDILISYLGVSDYNQIREIISRINNSLSTVDIELENDENDQDYYSLRSSLFAYYVNKILIKDFRNEYGNIIKDFIFKVPPFKIYKNYVFKRTAYDAELFYKLYGNSANDIYKRIYSYDDSAYTLQQWALYRSKMKNFKEAFADIDKAMNLQKNNFSIKNTRAIILFEANKDLKTGIAINGMCEAMEILEDCYKSDKRKIYHAQKYAEFAIHLYENFKRYDYINQALKWIDDIMKSGDSKTDKTRKLKNSLLQYKKNTDDKEAI